MVRVSVVVTALLGALGSSVLAGCQDPCVTLAERICNCEATGDERRACITDRVTNQQGTVAVDDDDRAFCQAILDNDGTDDACTCTALDRNELDKCGFAVEAGDE